MPAHSASQSGPTTSVTPPFSLLINLVTKNGDRCRRKLQGHATKRLWLFVHARTRDVTSLQPGARLRFRYDGPRVFLDSNPERQVAECNVGLRQSGSGTVSIQFPFNLPDARCRPCSFLTVIANLYI